MTEYNIGDRVRVKDSTTLDARQHAGQHGTVTSRGPVFIYVKLPTSPTAVPFLDEEIESYNEPAAPDPATLRTRADEFDAEAERQFDAVRAAQLALQAAQDAVYAAKQRADLYRAFALDLESDS